MHIKIRQILLLKNTQMLSVIEYECQIWIVEVFTPDMKNVKMYTDQSAVCVWDQQLSQTKTTSRASNEARPSCCFYPHRQCLGEKNICSALTHLKVKLYLPAPTWNICLCKGLHCCAKWRRLYVVNYVNKNKQT